MYVSYGTNLFKTKDDSDEEAINNILPEEIGIDHWFKEQKITTGYKQLRQFIRNIQTCL